MPRAVLQYVQRPEVTCTEISGERVLRHGKTGIGLEVDGVGFRIWRLLATRQTLESLTTALVTEYHVDEDVCAANTDAFLQYLVELDFLAMSDTA